MRRPISSALLVAISSSAASTSRLASPATSPDQVAVAHQAAEAGSQAAGRVISKGSPNSRAAAGFSSSNVQFSSENGETNLSVTASVDLQSYSGQDADGYYRVSRTRMSAVGSVPIDGEGKGATLFSGDSLVSGSKLKLSITHLSTRVGDGGNAGLVIAAAYRRCVSQNSTAWAEAQADRSSAFGTAGAFATQLNDKLSASGDVNFDGLFVEAAGKGDVGKYVAKACSPNADDAKLDDAYALVSTYGDDPLSFRRRFLPDNAQLSFWGVDASMGSDDHTYLDRVAIKLPTVPKTS